MRSYLASHDVRRMLFVRYIEDGTLIRRGGGNPILRLAQKSRAWLQNALSGGLANAPEVQNFLSGMLLGFSNKTRKDMENHLHQPGTLHLLLVDVLNLG